MLTLSLKVTISKIRFKKQQRRLNCSKDTRDYNLLVSLINRKMRIKKTSIRLEEVVMVLSKIVKERILGIKMRQCFMLLIKQISIIITNSLVVIFHSVRTILILIWKIIILSWIMKE